MAEIKECPRCLFTSEIAKIGEKQCEYCDIHDELGQSADPSKLWKQIDLIKKKGEGKMYDCLIGISGGLDSSLLLYLAVKKFGLRPLVIHFDNGWNNQQSESNMSSLIDYLNVNSIRYKVDKKEYDELNLSFLRAGLPDADIPNDIAMTKLMYQTAEFYGIKWILNGHDFRTEGSTPKGWTYMDGRYINDVYLKWAGENLKNYPIFTFKDQLRAAIKGIRQIRPFHYMPERASYEREMKEAIGWKDYGGKHCENIYTEFVGAYLLPNKFNIDKRLVYLSAQVRSGTIDKSEAKLIMQIKPYFDLNKLNGFLDQLPFDLMKSGKGERKNYRKYDFKKYRFVIWLLSALKVVPKTFYIKYAK